MLLRNRSAAFLKKKKAFHYGSRIYFLICYWQAGSQHSYLINHYKNRVFFTEYCVSYEWRISSGFIKYFSLKKQNFFFQYLDFIFIYYKIKQYGYWNVFTIGFWNLKEPIYVKKKKTNNKNKNLQSVQVSFYFVERFALTQSVRENFD